MEMQANIFTSNFLVNNIFMEIHWYYFRKKYCITKNFLFYDNQHINKNMAIMFKNMLYIYLEFLGSLLLSN